MKCELCLKEVDRLFSVERMLVVGNSTRCEAMSALLNLCRQCVEATQPKEKEMAPKTQCDEFPEDQIPQVDFDHGSEIPR